MLGQCRCGEIVANEAERCPGCGAPNEAYKPQVPRLAIAAVGGVLIFATARFGLPWYTSALGIVACFWILQAIRGDKRG